MAELLSSSTTAAAAAAATTTRPQVAVERRSRPQKEQALNCPRCNSTNTKFCYYNNYSLTQPRYFCKACRRYWTEGGSLRNVPVGGGSRKNKRSSSSIATPSATATAATSSQNPKFPNHSLPDFVDFPHIESSSSCTTTTSAMDLMRAGISGRGLGPFMQMPMPAPTYRPGFGLQDLRHQTLNFPLDDGTRGYGGLQGVQESSNGRLLFPFEDLKVSPSIAEFEQSRVQGGGDPPGFWNGMIGGGGSW